ncbi:MAG: PKD domain-containing protein [Luteolibacter sp.]
MPKGLEEADWHGIRDTHEAWRHEFREVNGRWQARNPGQQWSSSFNGRDFSVKPDSAAWIWGLRLRSYGFAKNPQTVSGSPEISASAQRLTYLWESGLEEWFVNDHRGLEHGFIVPERPSGASKGEPLTFSLSILGTLLPTVSKDAQSIRFCDKSGVAILNYSGLKVWDADGVILASRFKQLSDDSFSIVIDEDNARYPVTIDPIAQQAFLKASNTGAGDNFGRSVAVSGDTVVVGAPFEDSPTGVPDEQPSVSGGSGAAYVFVRSGTTWSQQAFLKGSNTELTGRFGDNFGWSVAVSGDTIVVGALGEDSSTTGVNGTPNEGASDSGAAYIFVRTGTTWSQQAFLKASNTGAGDGFGRSVAVSGDTVVVGATGEDSSTTGVNGSPNEGASGSGAAYVFVLSGTTWNQQAFLKASNTGSSDIFGFSVALCGNTLVVGATGEDSSTVGVNSAPDDGASASGAAYVFVRNSTAWSQQAYLKASNTGASDRFGYSVAVSENTVAVGSYREDSNTTGVNGTPDEGASGSGAAYVFIRGGTSWSQQAYLKASNTGMNDNFGHSVALSGDTVVVGSVAEGSSTIGINGISNEGAPGSGAAYVFVRSGTAWSQQAFLKASNTGEDDGFGWSVAVADDTVVVGAIGEASSTTGVNGTSNEGAFGSGASYIFTGFNPESQPPVAIADFKILNTGTGTVSLDASESSDPDGNIVSYTWTWAQGSASGETTSSTFPRGENIVTLTVTDNDGISASTTFAFSYAEGEPPEPILIIDDAGFFTGIEDVGVDPLGNIFSVGTFGGTVDFDPSDGPDASDTITAEIQGTGFLASYSPDGSFRFAIPLSHDSRISRVGFDPAGNVFIAGKFFETTDFDPGVNNTATESSGSGTLFFASYTNTGSFRFVAPIYLLGDAILESFAIDVTGNVVLAGALNGIADFDPSDQIATLETDENFDTFIASYTNTGNYQNAFIFGSARDDFSASVAFDGTGNIYVAGKFDETIDFAPSNGADASDTFTVTPPETPGTFRSDLYLASYTPAGAFRFAHTTGSPENDAATAVAVSSQGFVFITGSVRRLTDPDAPRADFDPGPETASPAVDGSFFLASYTTSGAFRYLVDPSSIGDTAFVSYLSICDDGPEGIAVSGGLEGSMLFPNGTVATGDQSGDRTPFVVRFDAESGAAKQAITFNALNPGNASGSVRGFAPTPEEGLILAGMFSGPINFDLGGGNSVYTTTGTDMFIAGIPPLPTSVPPTITNITVNPGSITLVWQPFGDGTNYIIEASPDLTEGSWVPLGSAITDGSTSATRPRPTGGRFFFRIVQP